MDVALRLATFVVVLAVLFNLGWLTGLVVGPVGPGPYDRSPSAPGVPMPGMDPLGGHP